MWARALALTIGLLGCATVQAADLRVACASNFKRTLQELAPGFESHTGHRLLISSASTGVLFNQLIHGAPFDVFLSADSQNLGANDARHGQPFNQPNSEKQQ